MSVNGKKVVNAEEAIEKGCITLQTRTGGWRPRNGR